MTATVQGLQTTTPRLAMPQRGLLAHNLPRAREFISTLFKEERARAELQREPSRYHHNTAHQHPFEGLRFFGTQSPNKDTEITLHNLEVHLLYRGKNLTKMERMTCFTIGQLAHSLSWYMPSEWDYKAPNRRKLYQVKEAIRFHLRSIVTGNDTSHKARTFIRGLSEHTLAASLTLTKQKDLIAAAARVAYAAKVIEESNYSFTTPGLHEIRAEMSQVAKFLQSYVNSRRTSSKSSPISNEVTS